MTEETLTYEKALGEIEEIVEQIRNEEISVEDIADKVKRVGELAALCRNKLTQADKEINEALNNLDQDVEEEG